MKYVLIHWIASNETSILTEECVKDKSMLENPDKKGMVLFGKPGIKQAPKSGWKAYLGRVVSVSEKKSVVMQQEAEFLAEQNLCEDEDDVVHQRKDPEAHFDHDYVNEHKRKKQVEKEAKKKAERKASQDLLQQFDQEDSGSEKESDQEFHDSTNTRLKMKIKKLEEQLVVEKELVDVLRRANLMLQKKLPQLLSQVLATNTERMLKQLQCRQAPKPSLPNVKDWESSERQLSATPVTLKRKYVHAETLSSSKKLASEVDETSDQEEDKESQDTTSANNPVTSSISEYIDPIQMIEIDRSSNEKKMTTNLLSVLFEKKILAQSSVTGNSKEGRPALDRIKVGLIIDHVTKRFPSISESIVRAAMAQKCKDERNSLERRRKAELLKDKC